MAKLILRGEDGSEKEFSLEESGSITIGRSPECEITITDSQASRRHCSVVRLRAGWELADLGSTNGTLLNSVLVKRKKLHHGDVIRIGSTEIAMHDPMSVAADSGEMANCFLVYARGEKKGEKVELTHQRTTIGRKDTNTIELADNNASSYHCEIVRGLNGYTIRDLGSTNGTLVNNEMITEAQLAHGARIRIGSTRFVFQDPAMAEIDLELAGVDDDEADWGMMRELDLAAVRRRNPATLVYFVLFIAILGGLGYLYTLEPGKKATGPQAPASSLIETYSFESPASIYAWEGELPGMVANSLTRKTKGEGNSALQLKSNVDSVDVFYADTFNANARRFTLKGKLSGRGATVRLGLNWRGLGLSRWSWSEAVSGGLTPVEVTAEAPFWASQVLAGLRIEGEGTAVLDDVALLPAGRSSPARVDQNDFTLWIVNDRDVDLAHTGAAILVHGGPFARDASGGALDAGGVTISAAAENKESIRVTLEGQGAVLGIEFEDARGYLSRGGFRGFGFLEGSNETYFTRSFPGEGTRRDERVRKLLIGNPGRAIAVLPAGEGPMTSIARVDDKHRFWSISGPAEQGKFSFLLKTDLKGETATATQRMSHATSLYRKERYGEFLEEAERALAEFPFANKATQKQLREWINEVNGEYRQLSQQAAAMIADYDEFKDEQSLERVVAILRTWKERFQVEPGQGPRGKEYADLAAKEAERRQKANRERQTKSAESFMQQALYIHKDAGELFSAAVMFTYVADWLPASEQAEQARKELAEIQKQKPEVLEVLQALGLRRSGVQR